MARKKNNSLNAPAWLSEAAVSMWSDVCDRVGGLQLADPNVIARYCTMYIEWQKAAEFVGKYGATYPVKDSKGNIQAFKSHPQVEVMARLSSELSSLEKQLRLSQV